MNPFRVLEISREADKQQIVRAAAMALQRRTFSAFEIAAAQRKLLDPVCRAELSFLYTIDIDSLASKRETSPSDRCRGEMPRLERLEIFDR
ncbi:MAG: hypothetical protein JXA30_08335 [Deltaproteobacteria bacterium]|nr:hypothetical protein [Deltaproteobacteria bacterium]